MENSKTGNLRFWLIGLATTLALLWVLRGVMLPFVAGMAIAYFLDPLVRRFGRLGASRTVAALVIEAAFFLVLALAIVILAPLIEDQVVHFAQKLPVYAQALLRRAEPVWRTATAYLSAKDIERLGTAAGDYAGTVVGWLGHFFTELVSGSLVVVNVMMLVFVTPVVTFYLLRDWPSMTAKVDHWLPRRHAQVIRRQLRAIDDILAGFLRGQAMLCLVLGGFYGLGLSLVGLDLGLVVGFGAGLVSFIPYLGTVSGFVVGISLALAQSQDWTLAAMVAGVFLVGNLLEGNVLAPKLVGEKIGLHPVWVIFALLAGGAVFGFLGILLALPVAAVVGVLARFALARYMDSPIYSGDLPGERAP